MSIRQNFATFDKVEKSKYVEHNVVAFVDFIGSLCAAEDTILCVLDYRNHSAADTKAYARMSLYVFVALVLRATIALRAIVARHDNCPK